MVLRGAGEGSGYPGILEGSNRAFEMTFRWNYLFSSLGTRRSALGSRHSGLGFRHSALGRCCWLWYTFKFSFLQAIAAYLLFCDHRPTRKPLPTGAGLTHDNTKTMSMACI
jgi:hypothetical protein